MFWNDSFGNDCEIKKQNEIQTMIPANDFATFEMAIFDYREVDWVVTSF